MKCHHCGSEVEVGTDKCRKCGYLDDNSIGKTISLSIVLLLIIAFDAIYTEINNREILSTSVSSESEVVSHKQERKIDYSKYDKLLMSEGYKIIYVYNSSVSEHLEMKEVVKTNVSLYNLDFEFISTDKLSTDEKNYIASVLMVDDLILPYVAIVKDGVKVDETNGLLDAISFKEFLEETGIKEVEEVVEPVDELE